MSRNTRPEALAKMKRQFSAETEARPLRCDVCRRQYGRKDIERVTSPCGLRSRQVCVCCIKAGATRKTARPGMVVHGVQAIKVV